MANNYLANILFVDETTITAFKETPTANAMCKYSTFKGTTIATVMCKSYAFKKAHDRKFSA